MKAITLAAAAATTALSAPAAAYTVLHNSGPASGWFFGSGNDYSPANSSVLTTDEGDQIALRFHQTFVPAPASNSGVYSFALGTMPLSFDWSFTNNSGSLNIVAITLTNVGTGGSFSYNPYILTPDNAVSGNTIQNSFRFDWIPGLFDPNVDSTYRVTFDHSGISYDQSSMADAGPRFLSIDAVFGAGAAAVPEPGTWALLILGFGVVGAALRRKASVAVGYA